jgi:hypothetical protein
MINIVTMAQPREVKMFQVVPFWDDIDLTGNADLAAQLDLISPHKIDENTWRNREQVEEILFLLHKDNWPSSLKEEECLPTNAVAVRLAKLEEQMQHLLTTIQEFQKASSERIFNMGMHQQVAVRNFIGCMILVSLRSRTLKLNWWEMIVADIRFWSSAHIHASGLPLYTL